MLKFFCRKSGDYAKMMLQELMKNATPDLGNISKAKPKKKPPPRSSKKAKKIALHLPWGKCSLIKLKKILFKKDETQ